MSSIGEMTHIDFGYMFESSRLLAVPERIPIRLTKQMTHLVSPIGGRMYQMFLDYMTSIKHVMRIRENYVIAAVSIFVNDALSTETKSHGGGGGAGVTSSRSWTKSDKENNSSLIMANSIIISDPASDKRSNMSSRKALFRVSFLRQLTDRCPIIFVLLIIIRLDTN